MFSLEITKLKSTLVSFKSDHRLWKFMGVLEINIPGVADIEVAEKIGIAIEIFMAESKFKIEGVYWSFVIKGKKLIDFPDSH